MVRNTHDLVNDHFGDLDDAQIASGTPASGDAPLSNGDGTRTWGPVAVPLHFENDDTSLSAPAVVFKDNVDTLAAMGSVLAAYAALILPVAHNAAELYAQTSSGTFYADLWAEGTTGRVEMYSSHGMLFPTLAAAPSGPAEAQAYYDTTTHKLRVYDGTTWQDCW